MKVRSKTKEDLLKELKSLQRKVSRLEKASRKLSSSQAEEIRRSEEKYHNIFEESFDGLFISSPQGKILDINKSGLLISGYDSKEEVFKLNLGTNVYPNPEERQRILSMVNSQGSAEYEVEFKKKGGEIRNVHCSLVAVKDSSGVISSYRGIIRDISKQRQSEKALRESEARLKRAELASKSGNWELHIDSQIMFSSEGAEKIYGLSKSPSDYKIIKNIPLPEYRPLLNSAMKNLIENNQPYDIEFKIKTADTGEIKDIHSIAEYDKERKILFGVIQDITSLKHIEDILHESEERYYSIFKNSIGAIFLIRPDGSILIANPEACSIFGRTEEELRLLGRENIVDITDPRLAASLEERTRTGRFKGELTFIRKDGTKFPGLVAANVFPDKEGNKQISLVIYDITDKKRTEEILIKNKALLRTLIDAIPDLIWLKDSEGRYLQCNRRFEDFFGAKEEEIAGKTDYDFVNKELADSFRQNDKAAIAAGKSTMNEEQVTFSDGHNEILETIKTPLYESDGRFIGVLGISHDITARKQMEEALFENKERMRAIVEGTPHLFFYTQDTEANITYVSPTVEQITGYKANIWLNRKDWFITDSIFNKTAIEKTHAKLRGEITEEPTLIEIRHAAGNSILLEVYEYPIIKNGILAGLRGVAHDITDKKRTEEELRQLNRKLHAISNCNQTLLRAVDEQTLLNDICRIICDEGGYRLVWVGYAEQDETKSVLPAAWAGFDSGYIANAKLSWADDTALGLGPAGKAIRSGEIICVQDFTTDPQMAPWRESALQHGYRSGIALPLKDESTKVFGVLLIYSSEPTAYTPDEIQLLEELSNDLAFGITALRNRNMRKRLENELQFKNDILSTQQEASIDGILVVDEGANIISYNHRFVEMWDIPIELVEKKDDEPVLKFVTDKVADTQMFLQRVRYLYKNNRETSQEEIVLKNGQIFERYSAPIIGPDNQFYGRVWYFHDITKRKQSEEFLKKQKDEFETIFNLVPAQIWFKDTHNNFIRVNSQVCQDIGITNDKIEGRSAEELFPAFARQYYEDDLTVINSGKPKLGIIEQMNTATGNIIWLSADKIPVFGEDGEVNGIILFAQNITERKRAEEELLKYKDHLLDMVNERTSELEQSRETFRALTENTKDVIIRVNDRFQFLYANAALGDIFGIPAKEYIGRTLSEIGFSKNITEGLESLLKKVFETKKSDRIEFQLPNGIWGDLIAIPEFDIDGNVCSIIISARDITEFKKLQLEIEDALEKEKELNQLKNRFISMISHEYRTPLTSILSSAEILELGDEKYTKEKKKIHFARIQKNVDYLINMIDEVLYANRIDSNRIELSFQKINLADFCTEIFDEMKGLYPGIKSCIKIDLIKDYYNIDTDIMKKILVNLISNAYKYNIEKGNVDFIINSETDKLVFKITDTGIGIPEDEQKNVFEPFARMSNVQHIKGTGLGLSIVKKSIEQLGGTIAFTSKKGEGTTFTVTIPNKEL